MTHRCSTIPGYSAVPKIASGAIEPRPPPRCMAPDKRILDVDDKSRKPRPAVAQTRIAYRRRRSPGGKALPRHRRAVAGLEGGTGAPHPAHQGDRTPLVGAVLAVPRLPGPQRALLQLVHGR